MGMYAVDTASSADLAELIDAAEGGRAAALLRRRQLSQGKQALNGGGAAPDAENRHVNGAGAPPTASNGQGAQGAPAKTAVATDGVADAHLGRNLSKQRRRQMSQGKQALSGARAQPAKEHPHVNGAGASPAASNGQGAQGAPAKTAVATDGVADAHLGRNLSKQRRRQMSQGKQALSGAGGQPAASNGQPTPSGGRGAPEKTAAASGGVADAHLGRNLSKQRRRELSQGKQALSGAGGQPAAKSPHANGAEASPAASNGQGAQGAPAKTALATDGVADAHLGRNLSKQRRRQLSQGKQALTNAGDDRKAAAAEAGVPAVGENLHVNGTDSGREQARARRAEASRDGSAGMSRPQREGRVTNAPKVIGSPTHGGQRVTGLRIGPGMRVTGDEPGAALPVSGSQYVGADGSAPASAAGRKVGMARTPEGLVVSGTTVRNKVAVTGDEAGDHLNITGEADQRLDDDLTPRPDGTYRSAQFPRRADPHGATAVGTRLGSQLGMAATGGDEPWHALETTDSGLAVTGTGVGRSGRVTGDEAGACRPITGAQYQGLSSSSSECAGTGGGTAPGAHLNRARLDPVTGGKVSVAQTWGGQRITGPNLEHLTNVTGDEPGVCRPMTGTPYQGPSTALAWCEPDEGESAAQRVESKPEGVAVTGDLPMPAKGVTGTERGQANTVTGTSYFGDMRPAEPAADDWAAERAFPVALARRLAGGKSDAAAGQETNEPPPSASSMPGSITGSFAVGDGMVTGNNEFLFRARPNLDGKPTEISGEGRTEGRTVTGSAYKPNDRVTGTSGYIAAGRNPSEGGGGPHGWAGAGRFRELATPGGPRQTQNVTGRSGWSTKAAARVTLSGGAQG